MNDDLAAFKKEKKGNPKIVVNGLSDPVGLQLEIAKARIAFGATVDSSRYEIVSTDSQKIGNHLDDRVRGQESVKYLTPEDSSRIANIPVST